MEKKKINLQLVSVYKQCFSALIKSNLAYLERGKALFCCQMQHRETFVCRRNTAAVKKWSKWRDQNFKNEKRSRIAVAQR